MFKRKLVYVDAFLTGNLRCKIASFPPTPFSLVNAFLVWREGLLESAMANFMATLPLALVYVPFRNVE